MPLEAVNSVPDDDKRNSSRQGTVYSLQFAQPAVGLYLRGETTHFH
jgi:hypothetical protein